MNRMNPMRSVQTQVLNKARAFVAASVVNKVIFIHIPILYIVYTILYSYDTKQQIYK